MVVNIFFFQNSSVCLCSQDMFSILENSCDEIKLLDTRVDFLLLPLQITHLMSSNNPDALSKNVEFRVGNGSRGAQKEVLAGLRSPEARGGRWVLSRPQLLKATWRPWAVEGGGRRQSQTRVTFSSLSDSDFFLLHSSYYTLKDTFIVLNPPYNSAQSLASKVLNLNHARNLPFVT